eukprot:CAMPEP_0197302382 /NCGR_PEP_ID=MMETSP0890-20130614/51013_1 /TAXON_ID=44058 ORGANISM="Aureoumbra lagunensis, Strain CCMP1510" /NCGR_SAMPLE_ID=MMETSP0890 /ASSEMBLY_ACC=CAM_ASM_000533 /LENGTH=358 /DNA_ID=CAMNT_0042781967 /DNA_START=110 /DNA_END=1186 /DNA_ORIENTATION=+
MKAKPSEEEINRRRAEKAAAKAAKGPSDKKAIIQQEKKRGDPVEEARILREEWALSVPLIDAGANLQSRNSREEIIRLARRAKAANVKTIVLTGCDLTGSKEGQEIAEEFKSNDDLTQFLFTAGIHPHSATEWNHTTSNILKDFAKSPLLAALGECGLDYDRMLAPREIQIETFKAQAQLAKELDLPLFIHCREKDNAIPKLGAHLDTVSILRQVGLNPNRACVHCFTGDTQDLELLVDFGCYIGFTGFIAIAKRCAHTLEAISKVGPSALIPKLIIETDAPFMLPDKSYLPNSFAKKIGIRGGKNEPAVLPAVAAALAAALSSSSDCTISPSDVATLTTNNAHAFFRFPSSGTRTNK